jgi:CubicO group peptidase (beta-lactamase class C family)
LIRDGSDAGQFVDRRPFLSAQELRAELRLPPIKGPNTRFKHSNHGYGLLRLVIEAVTGERYRTWIKREIFDAAGLDETTPDMPLPRGVPLAWGNSGRMLLDRRLNQTHAIGPARGFVSTAADLARYFAQLSPNAQKSILSIASRREMIRRQWRNPGSSIEQYYGLGTVSGSIAGWDWFGHSVVCKAISLKPACSQNRSCRSRRSRMRSMAGPVSGLMDRYIFCKPTRATAPARGR